MDYTLKKQDLEAALKIAGAITKPKTTYGEWFLVKEGGIFISQGIFVRVEVLLPGSRIPQGSIALHESTMKNLLPTLEPDILIAPERAGLKLTSGKLKSTLVTYDPANYPTTNLGSTGFDLNLDLEDFQAAIKDVEFAIADDVDRSTKEAFSGLTLRLEGDGLLRIIGARDPLLAVATLPVEKGLGCDFTMPREICTILGRLTGETVLLSDSGNGKRFKTPTVNIRTSILTSKLPDLDPILERARPFFAVLDREELKRALKQTQVFKDRTSRNMTLSLKQNEVIISAISQTAGKVAVNIPAKVDGVGQRLGLDMDYITSIVDRVKDDDIKLEIGANSELVAVQTEGRVYLAVASTPDKDFEDE